MAIRLVQGDLLSTEAEALVNTVNCVGVMGKGIALQFKKKWPAAFKDYKKACDQKELRPGAMHVFELGELAEKPYYIIHFPTKDHWRGKSEVSYIEDGLKALVDTILRLKIKSIAIPPLGCGNGGLEWPMVEQLITEALAPLGDAIEVQLFSSSGAPAAQQIKVNTERPKMTAGRAILIKLIALYRQLEYSLSKIEVQKLCYFAQEAGQPLRLRYAKNQFGPYADNLKHVLDRIDSHFVKGVGDHDTSETELVLVDSALAEADEFLRSDKASLERLDRVKTLIEGFETPLGMELLATVHWVAAKEAKSSDLDTIMAGITNWEPAKPAWNTRKTQVISRPKARAAIAQLSANGWI